MTYKELQHHGILGMKWGRLNGPPYPISPSKHSASEKKAGWKNSLNSGGSTEKNKKETASADKKTARNMTDEELQSRVKRMNLEKTYNKLSGETKGRSGLENAKYTVDQTLNATNVLKKINREMANSKNNASRMDLSKMTDQELRNAINRENLEIQYNAMFNKNRTENSRGKALVESTLNTVGDVLVVGSSALAIATAIKTLRE